LVGLDDYHLRIAMTGTFFEIYLQHQPPRESSPSG
jgi:hypothetical protein